jgi:hypothetical protein
VLNVARRVLGESEEEQWPTAKALRATVSASYLAANRRADPSFNPRDMWVEVRAWADHHPDETAAQVLRARAALGLLPYAADDSSMCADLQAAADSPVLAAARSPALAAAAVDAADRLLEAGALDTLKRALGNGYPGGVRELVAAISMSPVILDALRQDDAVPRAVDVGYLGIALGWACDGVAGCRVQAWAWVLVGRLLDGQDRMGALQALDDAEMAAMAADHEPAWADWVPPEDLLARVRIERGLLALVDSSAIATLPRAEWEAYAAAGLRAIDRERLASLCLQLRLADGPMERAEIQPWERLDVYEPNRAPICSAHDLVPPLFVTVAEATLAAGRPKHALALIEQRRTDALNTRYQQGDDSTLRACDAETVHLVRRLRLDDERATLARLSALGYSDPSLGSLRDAARRAMAIVHREPPQTVGPEVWSWPTGWHAWWQCQITPSTELPQPLWIDQPPDPGPESAHIQVDLEELRQLGHPGRHELERLLAEWLECSRQAPAPARSTDPFTDVRAALRLDALGVRPYLGGPEIPERRLAEVAFEEAELLALRLPGAAVKLFKRAAEAYARADDAIGRLMAAASLAAITGGWAAGTAITRGWAAGLDDTDFQIAWYRLQRQHPDVAAELMEAEPDADSWRFWRTRVQEILDPALLSVTLPRQPVTLPPQPVTLPPQPVTLPPQPVTLPPQPVMPVAAKSSEVYEALTRLARGERAAPSASAAQSSAAKTRRRPRWAFWAEFVLAILLGAAVPWILSLGGGAGKTASSTLSTLLAWLSVPVGLAVLAVGCVSLTKNVRHLADGQGVGTLRPASLHFEAILLDDPGQARHMRLVVQPRPLRGAPLRQWLQLALVLPAVHLARKVRKRSHTTGYLGSFVPAIVGLMGISWKNPPEASDRWWRRGAGAAEGAIHLHPALAAQPWERILARGLGAGAEGRIEWTRLMATAATPFATADTAMVAVAAPSAWRYELERRYLLHTGSQLEDSGPLRLRHAIGRAVATSAGPRFDMTGEATDVASARELLGTERLVRGRPALVILQAEPTDEAVDVGLSDDAPERLALAAELIEAGVPAVLTLPALQADLVRETAQLTSGLRVMDPERLRAEIRHAIKGHVEPSVLDDIVLFLNDRRDR